jgi:hypothetical protein
MSRFARFPLFLFVLVILCAPAWAAIDERIMLPMTDGVRLDTRVARPDTGSWPVVLYRTPYYELDGSDVSGYVNNNACAVLQNCRGRFNSEGENLPFIADGWGEHKDGLDTVNWILLQSWCDGKICTVGGSARGITQNMLAGADPPGICAQYISAATANMYFGTVTIGGAFRYEMVHNWLVGQGFDPSALQMFVEHSSYDSFWEGFNMTARQYLRNYAVMNEGGWYDCFQQANIDNFVTIRQSGGPIAKEHAKLVISATNHGGTQTGAFHFPPSALGVPSQYSQTQMLAHYIKDVNNGFENLPRVAYYMMGDLATPGAPGNEWRYADDWPVPATNASFYLHSDETLSTAPPGKDGFSITYAYDPTNPVPTVGGANLTIEKGNYDQRTVESLPDVILFETDPLPVPVEVTGRIWVYLYASSDALDTDFTAKLTDVYPDGTSVIICDGIRRARFRDSYTDPQPMTPGDIYRFEIDLWSTANVFNEGHQIRVAISSSNYPRFEPNPNTGAVFMLEDPNMVVANNTLYMDSVHPSAIVLPLTGPDSNHNGIPDILDQSPPNPEGVPVFGSAVAALFILLLARRRLGAAA